MSSDKKNQRITIISPDRQFVAETRTAFSASQAIQLDIHEQAVADIQGGFAGSETGVLIVDIDDGGLAALEALQRLKRDTANRAPIVVVVSAFDAAVVRILVQMQVADFLAKPVKTADLVRACIRALKGPVDEGADEATIHAFMPAAGGVGNTVLALQTAFILHSNARSATATCVVDLNFQYGSCAEYLDLRPAFDIGEVENRVERLDRQLLEAMLSKHESGLSVLAAPNNPSEQRSFDAAVVTRILDLVAAYFDNVVIDMPRTWFPWTEPVLRGSNHVYVTSELTVPCLRHTQRLLDAIRAHSDGGVRPKVIINRSAPPKQDDAVTRADVEELLGDNLAGFVANNYRLVREAVDRGVPIQDIDANANVLRDLTRIISPEVAAIDAAPAQAGLLNFGRKLFRKAG